MARSARGLALSWLGRIAVSVVVGLTLWGLAPPALAAGGPTDLAAVLLDPPSGVDWIPVPSGVVGGFHYGPLDAKTVAGENPDPAAVFTELAIQQFTRGYRKGWRQRASHNVVIERVEEFMHDGGAADHLAKSKPVDQTDPTFRGLFDTPGLDSGYGAQFVDNTGYRTASVVFTRGNLMFVVTAGSYNPVNTDMVLNQARYVYLAAPEESTVPDTRIGGVLPVLSISSAIEMMGGFVLFGLVLLLMVGLVILRPLHRKEQAARGKWKLPTFSSDRRYWWDGSRWQDVTILAPPTALRSSDGGHWFDGVLWRAVPPAAVLPAGQDGSGLALPLGRGNSSRR